MGKYYCIIVRNGKVGARMGAEYTLHVMCFWLFIGTWGLFYAFIFLFCIYEGVKRIYDYFSNKRTCDNSGADKLDS